MTYVISDIHGNYEKFKSILSQIGLRESDTLYILGDLLDYGDSSMELINDLSLRLNVYCIAGEHDFLAARMLKSFCATQESGSLPDSETLAEMTAWVQDGGQSTLEAFRALSKDEREGVLEYLEELLLFEELDVNGTHYLMVHAGIADYSPDTELDDYQPEDFFCVSPSADYPLIEGTTLIVGHQPTKSGRIERGEGSIFLDCGAAEGGALGCLCLETGKEFYA